MQEPTQIPAAENAEIDAFKAAHPEQVQQGSGSAGGHGEIDEQIKQTLMKSLQSRSQLTPLQINPTMKQMGLGQEIGVNLLSMFVPQIGGALQHHIKAQKEQQVNQVVNDFTILHNAWDEAQQLSGGDEQKAKQMFTQDPRVSGLFGDKKKMKLLSKAFGVDLMHPEKTQNNVAFQGLQRFLKLKDAKGKVDAVKAMQEQRKQQSQQQPQQNNGGAQASGGNEGSPQELAGNFLKMWPKTSTPPKVSEAEQASTTLKNLITAQFGEEPKTEQQQWYRAFKEEHGRGPRTEEIEAHKDAGRLKPIDQQVQDAFDLAQSGDIDGFKQKLDLIHTVSSAVKPVMHKNFVDMIYGANAGSKEDVAALNKYMALQEEMRMAYGKGRGMYFFQPYVDPQSGRTIVMDGVTYRDKLMKGEFGEAPPIPSGRLTSAQTISIQQLQTEAGPKGTPTYNTGALKGVYDYIGAYDNPKDRLIFAHAMNRVEHSSDWLATMKNALAQVETSKLSPDGQRLYVNLQRLAETMGRFRSSMGLPSTDQSMSLSLALLPGPGTPNSDMAQRMLDNLNQMIMQANVPALGGKPQQEQKKKKSMDF